MCSTPKKHVSLLSLWAAINCHRPARRGHFAIRTDAVAITAPQKGRLDAQVTAVEYQGNPCMLLSRITGDQEITSVVPEASITSLAPHFTPADKIWSAFGCQKPFTKLNRIVATLQPYQETTHDQIYITDRT